MNISIRMTNFICFLICMIVIALTLILEHVQGLEPCPLCIMQRMEMSALGLVFLISTLQNPGARGIRAYGIICLILAILGGLVSLRQLWLQHHPEVTAACMPSFTYLWKQLPLTETFKFLIIGTPECAVVNWKFLGASLAGWSFGFFLFFIAVSIFQILRARDLFI